MASAAAASDVTDGPVLTLVNKRIRNLRKKLNRIAQLEESLAQGKSAIKNKEQEELLKSKPTIVAAVDELEKFRQPLSVAVDEEISLAIQHRQAESSENNGKKVDDGDSVAKTLDNVQKEAAPESDLPIEDLLSLIYFASMFDVKSQSDFSSIMLTRTHERNCCLMYDYVTDDAAADMLGERDLDLISMMSSLLTSRPTNTSFSHQNALQKCIEHAKLWLAKSDQPIDSTSDVTYAALREKLAKIIGSDFFRITPAMKATADVAAEAAGSYGFQVPVQVEQKQEDDVTDFQKTGTVEENQSSPVTEHDSEEAVETHPSKEQYVPRRNSNNQRGGGGGGRNGGGGRRGGAGNGRGGRSGGRGGPYQNGGNGNHYPRNSHGGRGRGGGRGGGQYSNGGTNDNDRHASSGAELAKS